MAQSDIHQIRHVVIAMLRSAGASPIEAVDQWNRTYSRQVLLAEPGTHTIVIGDMEIEFTVPDIPSSIEKIDIKQAEQDANTNQLLWLIVGACTLAGLVSVLLVLHFVF